mgnify:CR=1 FL=1
MTPLGRQAPGSMTPSRYVDRNRGRDCAPARGKCGASVLGWRGAASSDTVEEWCYFLQSSAGFSGYTLSLRPRSLNWHRGEGLSELSTQPRCRHGHAAGT